MKPPRRTPGQDPSVLAWRSAVPDVDDLYVDLIHTPGPDFLAPGPPYRVRPVLGFTRTTERPARPADGPGDQEMWEALQEAWNG